MNLRVFQHVAVGGVDRVHHGRSLDVNGRPHLADFQSHVQGCGSIGLHEDRGQSLGLEPVMGDGDGVGADGQVDEIVGAIAVCFLGTRELGLVPDDANGSVWQHAAALIGDGAGNAAQSLLRQRIDRELKQENQYEDAQLHPSCHEREPRQG